MLIEDLKVLNEASLGRLHQHVNKRDVGIISACRGMYDVAQNNMRTTQLKSDIVSAGFGFMNIKGSYVEGAGTPEEKKVTERSFFVISNGQKNALLNFLKRETAKFAQESFLFKQADNPKAVFMDANGQVVGTIGEFHIGKLGDYASEIRGRNFTFIEITEEANLFTKWASHGKTLEHKIAEVKNNDRT